MKLLKNFEAAFIGATAIAIASAALLAPETVATAAPEQQAAPMHVVVVSAKRLTLEEKLQSLREERQLAAARQQTARG
jgi:Flp pilus assembly protein CpaB